MHLQLQFIAFLVFRRVRTPVGGQVPPASVVCFLTCFLARTAAGGRVLPAPVYHDFSHVWGVGTAAGGHVPPALV